MEHLNDSNLRKAKRYFRVVLYAAVLVLLAGSIFNLIPALNGYAELLIIPFLVCLGFAPLGLIYLIKSYWKKEPYPTQRLFYLLGLVCFNLVIFFLIYAAAMGSGWAT